MTIITKINPSRILHNPSRMCEGFHLNCTSQGVFDHQNWSKRVNPSQSFTGVCEGFVKDFKARKTLFLKDKTPLSLKSFTLNAICRAQRNRAYKGKWGRISDSGKNLVVQRKIRTYINFYQRKIRTYERFKNVKIVIGTSMERIYVTPFGTIRLLDTLAFTCAVFSVTRMQAFL